MRSGRAFPSTPIAAYAAQRARASLLLEASVTAPYRQKYQSASLDRPRVSRPRGVVLQPYAAQRARASLVLEALVTAPYRQQSVVAVEGRKAEHRQYGIQTSYAAARARASLVLEALVSPPQTRTLISVRAPAQRRHGSVQALGPPLAAVATPPPLVTPPRTTLLVSQERQARTRFQTILTSYPAARAAASLALEALVTPPQTRLLVEAARLAGPHRSGSIQASYSAQRARASLLLEALVTPPVVQSIIRAAAGRQHRHGSVTQPWPPLQAVTVPPLVTAPQTRLLVVARTPAQHRHGAVQAAYASMRGAASLILEALVSPPRVQQVISTPSRIPHRPRTEVLASGAPRIAAVSPPLPVIVSATARRRVARHGCVIEQRPVLLPGQFRPQPRVVAPLSTQQRRRRAGRVISAQTRISTGPPPPVVASLGMFSDNPQTGLADSPAAAPFSDQAQTGVSDSPRSGGWDKHL